MSCNGASTGNPDDDAALAAHRMKLKLEKERKARNQRRYYQSHKTEQQEKARQRASNEKW
ncbi:hypothetical protein PILCRDRAFT_7673 [Piloderma croceum F 1598]|uniref:Uncharacterized protein n=1 Tax=Piloderma croceum (strain F 1598) TaxID=765440 RepID=A0A0C3BZH7_PILCF|nr:hypothetical protein PILCRDRAFT_7673 [Piloderma croceum F 1598]